MGIRSSLRRADWLAELQTVLAVGLVLGLAGAVVSAGQVILSGTVRFSVPTASVGTLTLVTQGLRDGAGIDVGGQIDVVSADPTGGQRLAALLTHLPSYLVGLVVLALLWRVVRQARRSDPFSAVVARRLRWLGAVALGGGLIADTVQLLAGFFGSRAVLDGPASVSYRYSWWWLLVGFGFLAIGEVVRRGAVLRAELDTVV